MSVYFGELVERHFYNENYHSPMVSVSSHKDVAIAVGRYFGRKSLSEKTKDLYLFKINVPEIDLIYFSDHGQRLYDGAKKQKGHGFLKPSRLDVRSIFSPSIR